MALNPDLERLLDDANGYRGFATVAAASSPLALNPPMNDAEAIELLEQGEMGNVAVLKPRVYQRNGVYFVGARQWFAPAKLQGVQMMKAAKDTVDEKTAQNMAADIALVARLMFEGAAGSTICGPSPRHSAFIGVPHFAKRIAELAALDLGWPHQSLFEVIVAKSAGHSTKIRKDPPKVIKSALPASGRVLLIDDVATSGETLEVHAKALRAEGMKVSIIVWVYGHTSGVGR